MIGEVGYGKVKIPIFTKDVLSGGYFSMTSLNGYASCPGCDSKALLGTFYPEDSPSLESNVEKQRKYQNIRIFNVTCTDCGAIFYASLFYRSPIFYKER